MKGGRGGSTKSTSDYHVVGAHVPSRNSTRDVRGAAILGREGGTGVVGVVDKGGGGSKGCSAAAEEGGIWGGICVSSHL